VHLTIVIEVLVAGLENILVKLQSCLFTTNDSSYPFSNTTLYLHYNLAAAATVWARTAQQFWQGR
jgi:hypothetical protein